MAHKGHRPQRTCLGCGTRDDQGKMIRLRVEDQGSLKVVNNGGRGGYLHRVQECWQSFVARKSHYRAFHVEINRGAKEKLIQQLKDRDGE